MGASFGVQSVYQQLAPASFGYLGAGNTLTVASLKQTLLTAVNNVRGCRVQMVMFSAGGGATVEVFGEMFFPAGVVVKVGGYSTDLATIAADFNGAGIIVHDDTNVYGGTRYPGTANAGLIYVRYALRIL